MTAELAKPDSLGDLAKDDEDEEDYHEQYGDTAKVVENLKSYSLVDNALGDPAKQEEEEGEKSSLLADNKRDSPSIQSVHHSPTAKDKDIKVDIDQGKSPRPSNCSRDIQRDGGCYSVCGPNPIKASVLCLLVISFWILLVVIIHLDKKVTRSA